MTLFVQLYESNTAAVKSEIATFLEVFPGGVVWGNTNNGAGYDLVLLGQAEPTRIDVEAVQRRLSQPEMLPVARSLGEIGMYSAVDLFSNYAGTKTDLAPWLADAVINRDRNLAPAVPRRHGLQPVSERSHLRRHAAVQPLSGRNCSSDRTPRSRRSGRRSCGCRGSKRSGELATARSSKIRQKDRTHKTPELLRLLNACAPTRGYATGSLLICPSNR